MHSILEVVLLVDDGRDTKRQSGLSYPSIGLEGDLARHLQYPWKVLLLRSDRPEATPARTGIKGGGTCARVGVRSAEEHRVCCIEGVQAKIKGPTVP